MNEANEPFDPTTAAHYRTVLGCVPTSVAVIAAMTDEVPIGVAVGSFTSVSLDPPLVGFFIAHTSSSWPRIAPTGGFTVSVLGVEQEDVCRAFAVSGADKFAACTWTLSPGRRPIIDGAVAWMDCTIASTQPAGDHLLVLGHVDAMGSATKTDPLVFLGGRYGRVAALDSFDGPAVGAATKRT
jgi:3-hydroxy-9,10-secoandrosta-1,3,5(10)-triene-9,17-dione monooxygenase reductase component